MVGDAAGEDLGLSGKATEGARLHDAFAVALEGGARLALGSGKEAGPQDVVRVCGDRAQVQVSTQD
jgi:hypothetical protein